ncbi:DNA/RNA helicase domain-containing protein [Salinivirga cyanobacteriivorans]|uniref:DNA/RNA helicase domain-containing protein n=1 Tax=Salinivirga cyanobacteriivorans TaxID=1307839 RepID=UPI000AC86C47|nr:DNA/RNA helicase domain-containing protein [Salinivirga cyanobacteriivorans]
MLNYYFKDSIQAFLTKNTEEIIGEISLANQYDSTLAQNKSWEVQISILRDAFENIEGTIFFEFSIPRMGKRVDVLAIIHGVVFVIKFKVGEHNYNRSNLEQVWDYALDLKNFHEPSHKAFLVPILVATEAKYSSVEILTTSHKDNLSLPIKVNKEEFRTVIGRTIEFFGDAHELHPDHFAKGRYYPTPTIVEAALTLYNSHTVDEITRSDAEAKNLTKTTSTISKIIATAKQEKRKIICFVTGVPGAGKTLVGLKVATSHLDEINGNASVYLSGNGPLVAILQEALARDKIKNEKANGIKLTKGKAKSSVKTFVQNIHHYRDAYLVDPKAPYDHVAIFDEAQRAWSREQTVKFMRQKKRSA